MRVRGMGVVLTALLAGCAAERGVLQEADIVGEYTARIDAPSGAREFTLALSPGNVADMMSVSPVGTPVVEVGTWTAAPDRRVRVVLARGGLGAVTTDVTFRVANGQLTAPVEDSVRWGATGLVFERRMEPR